MTVRRALVRALAAVLLGRATPRTAPGPTPGSAWVTPARRRTDRHPRTRTAWVTRPGRAVLPRCGECDGSGITTDPIDPTDPTPCPACPAGEAWTSALVAVATDPEEN